LALDKPKCFKRLTGQPSAWSPAIVGAGKTPYRTRLERQVALQARL
jgi:hypothetical protein